MISGPPCRSIAEAARALGTTDAIVRRVLQIARLRGREGLQQAQWGGDRKFKHLTAEQLDWILDPRTLREQVGLPLKARGQQFKERFGQSVTAAEYRRFYRQAKITRQKLRFRLGAQRLPHPLLQQQSIARLQEELRTLRAEGYQLLIADETLFSADSFGHMRHWAPSRQPLGTTSRFTNMPKIVVCGVISAERGNVLYRYGERSFNAQDMEELL